MGKNLKLISNGFYLPYNPKLVERAKEMRKNPTLAEKKLWYEYLRYFPLQALRQRPIGNYIVDFYIPKLKLVIEIDGETHISIDEMEYDNQRTDFLTNSYGLKVIRFWNYDVINGLEGVCEVIANELNSPNPLYERGL